MALEFSSNINSTNGQKRPSTLKPVDAAAPEESALRTLDEHETEWKIRTYQKLLEIMDLSLAVEPLSVGHRAR